VKKVPVIHISILHAEYKKNEGVLFLCQKGASYTHFYRRKKLGFFLSKKRQLCTFLEFNFFRKNEKKNISAGPSAGFYPRPLSKFFHSQQHGLRSDYDSIDL
jgi:hypothetical protein